MRRRATLALRPTVAAAALLCATTFGTLSAGANAQSAAPATAAPATRPLAEALAEFQRTSGAQLVYAPALVQGRRARAAAPAGGAGSTGDEAALQSLLDGTGLRARRVGSTWVIEEAAAGRDTLLPAVRVTGQAERADGPVQGLVARRSASATKTDTPLLETPQSVSVIGAGEIEAMKAQRLQDVLAYTAGVGVTEGYDHTTDSFVIRGFQAYAGAGSIYRDGTRYLVNVYDGTQEPYGLERVEVLKGAASVLYGSAAPGGIINTVTKRPTGDSFGELNLELGSWQRRQLAGDFGGRLTQDGDWSWRLTALGRESDTMVDHVPDDRTYLAPALRWQPNGSTSLTLLAHYQKSRTAYVYGLPPEATLLPNPNGRLPTDRFIGEPGYDRFENTIKSVGALFEHRFGEGLTLRASARSFHAVGEFPSVWIFGLQEDGRTTLDRGAQDRTDRSRAQSADTHLEWKLGSGRVSHTVLAGLDLTRSAFETERYDRTLPNLDLYDPDYGGEFGPPEPAAFAFENRSTRAGIYLQDQMKIDDRWVVLADLRHDRIRERQRLFFDPSRSWELERSQATTGRFGLVYLLPNGVAPYASYTESFEPQTGVNENGGRLEPTRGKQVEIGVRWQPEGSETLVTAALYELRRTNVPKTVDAPGAPGVTRQIGEERSRGFELEARSRVGRHADVIAAYAYTDTRTTKSGDPDEVGRRSGSVPYHQLAVRGEISAAAFSAAAPAALRFGLGARHVGSTLALFTVAEVPSYNVVDASARWSTGPWQLALNVNNVADRKYVASCTYDCFYGERRKIIGTVGYRW